MNKKFETYIFEDQETAKEKMAESLMSDDPHAFAEEKELENLLSLTFEPLDATEKVLKTVKRMNYDKPALAIDVLTSIRTNEKRSKKILIYIASSAAAVLALSLVLISLKKDSNANNPLAQNPSAATDTNLTETAQTKKTLKMPEGVVLTIYEGASYKLVNKEHSYLELIKGKVMADVETRENKTPLLFKMPHSTVKVTGTSFILSCDTNTSTVTVTEGSIELITENDSLKINTGESGTSGKDLIKKFITQPDKYNAYAFETLDNLHYTGSPKIVEGVIGNALLFDGASSVNIPRGTNINNETISFWFKKKKLNSEAQHLLGQHNAGSSSYGFTFYLKDNRLGFHVKSQPTSHLIKQSFEFTSEEWHHVIFRRHNDQIEIFLNGKSVMSDKASYSYRSGSLMIGKSPDGFWKSLWGFVDEVRVYDRTLTDKEINDLYNEKNR